MVCSCEPLGGGASSGTGAILRQSGVCQLGEGVAHDLKLLTPLELRWPARVLGDLDRWPGGRLVPFAPICRREADPGARELRPRPEALRPGRPGGEWLRLGWAPSPLPRGPPPGQACRP